MANSSSSYGMITLPWCYRGSTHWSQLALWQGGTISGTRGCITALILPTFIDKK